MYKRFFRRVLPFILSVVMTVEMIPATAFAAQVSGTDDALLYDTEEKNDGGETEEQLVTEIRADGYNPTDIPFKRADFSDSTAALADVQELALSVYVNGIVRDDLKGKITCQWQKAKESDDDKETAWEALYPKNENNSALWENLASGELPKNAGKYLYTATLGAEGGDYEAASLQIPCEITKSILTVDYNDEDDITDAGKLYVMPGKTFDSFIKTVQSHLVIRRKDKSQVSGDFFSSIDVSVKEKTGAKAEEGGTFQSGVEYLYSIVPVLKDDLKSNYAIDEKDADGYYLTNRKVIVGDISATRLIVTDINGVDQLEIDPGVLSDQQPLLDAKSYDGKEALDAVREKIKMTVHYDADPDPNTAELWTELTQKEDENLENNFEFQWWDAGCNYTVDAPKDAGTYVLGISYKGLTGMYKASNEVFIRVRIKPAEIYIKPKLEGTFYPGMNIQDVLKKVSYDVFQKGEGDAEDTPLSVDRGRFWGIAINREEYKQAYTPLFKLMCAGKNETLYQDCDSTVLDSEKRYIVVFSGLKTAYDASGESIEEISINEKSLNSASSNYHVLVDRKTLLDHAVEISVGEVYKTEVNVEGLLTDGKGKSFKNPIVSVYNGKGIYAKRADYKKAVVKDASEKSVAENTSSKLRYQWQKLNPDLLEEDDDSDHDQCYENWYGTYSDAQIAPSLPGSYRLEISFSDPDHQYVDSENYVYYEIQPRLVMAEPSGEYTAYIDTTAGEFLEKNRDKLAYGVKAVDAIANIYQPEAGDEETLVIPAHEVTWWVEALQASGAYEKMDDADPFEAGRQYRLVAGLIFSEEEGYADHYTDQKVRPWKEYSFYAPLAIKAVSVGTGVVKLSINTEQFSVDAGNPGQYYKVYDGNAVEIPAVEKLITVKGADGKEIAGFPMDQIVMTWKVTYDTGEEATVPAPKNAGSYTLSVSFPGNEKYAPTEPDAQNTKSGICRIGRKDLVIKPVARDVIEAGKYFAPAEDFPISRYLFDGVEGPDAEAFRCKRVDGMDVIDAFEPSFGGVEIFDKYDSKKAAPQRYKSDMEYYARTAILNTDMVEPYCYNYNIINAKTVHTAACVGSQIYSERGNAKLRVEATGNKKRIIPLEGLPYGSKFEDFNGKEWAEGNYFSFRIQAPAEFNDPDNQNGGKGYDNIFANRAFFVKSIDKAGGAVKSIDDTTGEIVVAFPASAEDKRNAKFEIYWQDHFTETFEVVLEKALLCGDTSKAVLPKSIKFNNALTKMAVGEAQQLNLTVVKNQVADEIRIVYEVSDTSKLNVTKNGYLTALSVGKATVFAYPARIVDGQEEKIGTPAKVAITISDVAKPVISKLSAQDNVITVRYKALANGYRREFYVLEGKKTAQDFEDILDGSKAGMTNDAGEKIPAYINNDWRGAFAIAPVYGDGDELPGEKPGIRTRFLGGTRYSEDGVLDFNTEYTVYVRNVSGVRTLHDGSVVSASAMGVAKTIWTTRENVQELDLTMDENYAASAGADCDYEVPFADRSIKTTTYGKYHAYHIASAAESNDMISMALPIPKEDKEALDKYLNPKLSYFVTDTGDDCLADAKLAKAAGYTVKIGSWYYRPTKLAAINKSGKLTLKGLGTVRVRVYDSVTGRMGSKDVRITADVNAFSGKKCKTKVGQKLDLFTMLTYQSDGVNVAGYPTVYADPYVVLPESNEELGWFIDDEGMFVGTKPGKYKVVIRDDTVKAKDDTAKAKAGEATVTVTVSSMAPVKGLKSIFVFDAYAKIRFTYSSKVFYAGTKMGGVKPVAGVDFRVDIRDGGNKLIYSQLLDGDDEENYALGNGDVREYQYLISGLKRRSSYKVSVTAFCGGQESKVTAMSFKTTGVPASYTDMDSVYQYEPMDYDFLLERATQYLRTKVVSAENGFYKTAASCYRWNEPEQLPYDDVSDEYQGVHIETWGVNEMQRELDEYPFFTSGNSYILRPREDDLSGFKSSYLSMSDTLTWSVKDKKIASVKALKGSFSAKLKASRPGTTMLEVRSKNTKKVIARYKIMVKAVGDGHDFFGDYNDYDDRVPWDPTYEKAVEVLHVGNPFSMNQADNEYVWVCYEAKESGVHIFSKYGGKAPDTIKICNKTMNGKDSGWTFGDLEAGVYLYEGMKIYMKVEGFVYYLMAKCTSAVVSDSITVDTPMSTVFSYTATEEGCYTFTPDPDVDFLAAGEDAIVKVNVGKPATPFKNVTDEDFDQGTEGEKYSGEYKLDETTNAVHVLLKKGVTIRMKVKGTIETQMPYKITVTMRQYTELAPEEKAATVSQGKDAWFKFKAPSDGGYAFKVTGATEAVKGYYYDSLDQWEEKFDGQFSSNGGTASYRLVMRAGDTAAFRISTTAASAAAKVSMSAEEVRELTIEKPVTDMSVAGTGTVAWIRFEVPDSVNYTWNLTKPADESGYEIAYRINDIFAKNGKAFSELESENLKEGDIVYITIKSKTADPKSFGLSVSKVQDKTLTSGGDDEIEENITDDQELWYTFTAPAYGIYGFAVKKLSGDDRPITVKEYDHVGATTENTKTPALNTSGVSVHRVMDADETVVFKVAAGNITDPETKSSIAVKITQCEFTPLGKTGAVVFDGDNYAHHRLTIERPGTYSILVKSGDGRFDLMDAYRKDATTGEFTRIEGLTKDVKMTGVSLEKNDSLYFILRQRGEAATGTITVEELSSGTSGTPGTPGTPGTEEDEDRIEETIELEAGETKWLSYQVKEDARYYITSTTNAGSCEVWWGDAYNYGRRYHPDEVYGDILKAGDTIYIMVKKDDDTAGTVTLIIEKVKPGTFEAEKSYADISMAPADHTWYTFKAEQTGYYQFDYSAGASGPSCEYFEPITSDGKRIGDMRSPSTSIIFMEKGAALDFHFYDEPGTSTASMKITGIKVEDSDAWYQFKAPRARLYRVTVSEKVKNADYYVSKADSGASSAKEFYVPAVEIFKVSSSTTLLLQENDKLLVKLDIDGTNGTDVTVTITDKEVVTFEVGIAPVEKELQPDGNGVVYVQFKKTDTTDYAPLGTYFIRSASSDNDCGYKMTKDNGTNPADISVPAAGDSIFEEKKPSDLLDAVYIIKTNDNKSKKFKLKIERALPEARRLKIAANETSVELDNIDVEMKRYTYVSFMAKETAWYTFEKYATEPIEVITDNKSTVNINHWSFAQEVRLDRGTEVVLKVKDYNTEGNHLTDDAKEKITVSQKTIQAIEKGTTSVTIPKKRHDFTSEWYSFTSDKLAKYTFTCAGDPDFSLSGSYPHPDSGRVINNTELQAGVDYYLARGETVYIQAKNIITDPVRPISGSITVTSESSAVDDEVDFGMKEDEDEKVIEYIKKNDVEYVYFVFTPDEDGYYDFTLDDETKKVRFYPNGIKDTGDPDAAYSYNGYGNESKMKNNSLCNFIPAGKTVILRNHEPFGEDDFTLTLTVKRNYDKHRKVIIQTDDTHGSVMCPGESGYDMYRYNVPASGYYVFSTFELTPEGTRKDFEVKGIALRDHPGNTVTQNWSDGGVHEIEKVYLWEGEKVYPAIFPFDNDETVYGVAVEKVD